MRRVLLLAACVGDVAAQRACTMEAKVCPDGSTVGRSGPNCEFAPCPGGVGLAVGVDLRAPILPGFCTADAKICPDGSSVGRVPPSCNFAPCPGGGGGQCRTNSDCGPGMCCIGGINPFPIGGRRLMADDPTAVASASFGFAGADYAAGASILGGGLRQCRPMGSEGDSCDGYLTCPCGPGLQCVSDFGGGYGSIRRCRRIGGGSGGFCQSNSDCPSGCCRRSLFGTGTCGNLAQAGEQCSTSSWGSSCPCAAGLVCQGGLFGYGNGRCVSSGGTGGSLGCGYCPPGTTCKNTGIVCVRYPCPESWQCMPDTPSGGGCAVTLCPAGTRCEETPVVCVTYPCPPLAKCVPITNDRCGENEEWTSCGSSSCWEDKCGEDRPARCTLDCRSGCRCKTGYRRNYDGRCTSTCYVVGRPFSTDKGYLMSPILPLESPTLNVSSADNVLLTPDEKNVLAASHWSRLAMMEHASVASFARFSMELMALGAPLPLLHAAHQAAQDEVRHAHLALSLANKFGNTKLALGEFPLSPAHFEFGNLSDVAQATALEGCVEETIAALVAAVQAEHFGDPTIQAALRDVALEEASHAALAWRSIQWMLTKSDSIRAKVSAVIHSSRPEPHSGSVVVSPLASLGMLGEDHMTQLRNVGYHKIVVPTATSLGLFDTCEEQSEDLPEAAFLRSYLAKALE